MAEKIGPYRIIDLTHKVIPSETNRRCRIRLYQTERDGGYQSEMDIMSHLGTHLEAPKHFDPVWNSVSDYSASKFMGRGVMLKITDIEPAAKITPEHLEKASQNRVRPGDIILLETPYHVPPFSFPENEIRPYVNADMAQWLVDKEVKCIGFSDSVDIETNIPEYLEFHRVAMAQDVLFLEVLENFDQIRKSVFFLTMLPMWIDGLDSCPVRVVAIEGIPGFDE